MSKMKRITFLKSLLGIPALLFLKEDNDKKTDIVDVPKWIVDRFKNEDQIGIERMYHDSEFLFPENDHTKISVPLSKFYPWEFKRVYPAYKGDMYVFILNEKFKVPQKALMPYFSR